MENYFTIDKAEQHIHINFREPFRSLSSAVLNGGIQDINHCVNLVVPRRSTPTESPADTILDYCQKHNWEGKILGMMTAASMESMRLSYRVVDGIYIGVIVTSGLSNPLCAGDYATYRKIQSDPSEIGTINIFLITSATLTDAALAETLMIVTEAKSHVLHKSSVKSIVSDELATGTGTDSTAILSAYNSHKVEYCGKHVLFGETVGTVIIEALSSSIEWYFEKGAGSQIKKK